MDDTVVQLGQKLSDDEYNALLVSLNKTALVSMTNAAGDIIYANEKFVEVSKYPLKELLGHNHRILKSGEQPDSLFVDLWKTISSGRMWRGEIKNRAKDGSLYWVDTSIAPILDKSGQPYRYISVRFLITDKKEHEAQLKESRVKAETILASIGEGLILFNAEGEVDRVNHAAEQMLGLSETTLRQNQFADVVGATDEKGQHVPVAKRPFTRALQDSKTITMTMRYPRSTGGSFPVQVNIAPVILGDKTIGAVEIFRDSTHEHELERAKDEFVSLTSHQLRTPLTAIRLFSEMLGDELAGPLNAEQRDYLDKIQESTERMISLVGDILNISRIEAGRLHVDPQPTNLRSLIESWIAEIEPIARSRRIVIKLRIAKDVPKLVKIDRNLFGQVIHNLLTNALRYTQPGQGKVIIHATKQSYGIIISVKDNGIGIPEAVKPRIFERFFRADNATLAAGDGTGLGLYLVKMVMESTGGDVWFESQENKGTTFYVRLPLNGMRRLKAIKEYDED